MSVDQAVLNRIWSEILLEELARLGVEDVCIAPGSRSTPLTLEADANPKLILHSHFDERGLGFYALGLAKASQKPVAVIVTSGTAVANLLPAIVEAGLTREKLIVLTSDRPIELIGCGANQAIQQQGIFSSHVTESLNLPSPSQSVPLNWLLSSIDHVVQKQSRAGGVIHVNCPFPEPLYSDGDKATFSDYTSAVSTWRDSSGIYSLQLNGESEQFSAQLPAEYLARKGAVVIGSLELADSQKILEWSKQLGWPVFCDPQSGATSNWAHYDLWMQLDGAQQQLTDCDFIIQFGERLVSKRLNRWISSQCKHTSPSQYVVVSSDHHRINQSHLSQTHLVTSIEQFISQHPAPTLLAQNCGWADPLIEYANSVTELAQAQLTANESLTELAVAMDLSARVNQKHMFIGNSLIVRLADMFSALDGNQVFSNRGASGIDGLVATAAGVVSHTQTPTLMLIGDTSLLYDLNSLALFSRQIAPVVIVVTNNDGGAIFDLLPVPEKQKQSLYQLPHGFDFRHAAAQFGLKYCQPETLPSYQSQIEHHFNHGSGALLVEVKTPPEQASTQLTQFMNLLRETLN